MTSTPPTPTPTSTSSVDRPVAARTPRTTRARGAALDLVLLVARAGLGVVLIAHGLMKWDAGVSGTADGFAAMGIPYPEAAATFAIVAELGGGALLILGALTPLAALLVIGQMAGAFWYAHRGTEVMVDQGGWELVALIGLLALILVVTGAGRLSVDRWLFGRKRSDSAGDPVAV